MAKLGNVKIITDSVHGQICIPVDWCEKIVDTNLFQRLRYVGQSFISALFPSATHNRFTHSLGVYHIGCKLFDALEANTTGIESIKDLFRDDQALSRFITHKNEDGYAVVRNSFHAACLLHDCAHSPFSHTFENYYTISSTQKNAIFSDIRQCAGKLANELVAAEFCDNLEKNFITGAVKPHELVSAWLVLRPDGFSRALKSHSIGADPLLAARMITGTKYKRPSYVPYSGEQQHISELLNCFISLLNGNLIDADRIDYAKRDQWATGVCSANFNEQRMFGAIQLGQKELPENKFEYVICYDKRGLSELQSLAETKNFYSYWMFNHHKFKILEYSLVRAVTYLSIMLCNKAPDYQKAIKKKDSVRIGEIENESLVSFFDYKTLLECKDFEFSLSRDKRKVKKSESLHLFCDDDIVHLLKKYFYAVKKHDNIFMRKGKLYFDGWFSREGIFIPLWKSYYEFNNRVWNHIRGRIPYKYHSDNSIAFDSRTYDKILEESLSKALCGYGKGFNFICLKSDLKVSGILKDPIYVRFHDKLIMYNDLDLPQKNHAKDYGYFRYMYILNEDCNPDYNYANFAEAIYEGLQKLPEGEFGGILDKLLISGI